MSAERSADRTTDTPPATTADGRADADAASVATMLFDRVEKSARREAFRYLDGGKWTSLTWQEAAEQVEALAAGLLALGIEPEQRVGIASSTRYEWILADLAIMCAGGATTTVYPTTNGEDTAYILGDSESRFVFAEDEAQLEKLRERRDELPGSRRWCCSTGAATATGSPPSMRSSSRASAPARPPVVGP